MPEQLATETVFVSDAELAIVRNLAVEHSVTVEAIPQRGSGPIEVISLAIIGLPVAVSTVVHLIDQLRGGQVIDLRPGIGRTFYRTTDLEYGKVVVLTSDGKVTIEVHAKTKLSQTIDALAIAVTGLKGGVDMKQVAAQVEHELRPEDASVSVEPDTGL